MGNTIRRLAFPFPDPPYNFKTKPHYITNSHGDRLPTLYFPYKNSKEKKLVIFSHGNATDLAASETFLIWFRDTFDVSVLGYEYLGYGYSVPKGTGYDFPSEQGCYEV